MNRTTGVRRSVVAFYGEHPHDAQAIRELTAGIRPEISSGHTLRILKSPPTLVKDLQVAKRRTRASKVVATLRAVAAKDGLRAVVFHEDADRPEPAHIEVEKTYREAYSAVPCEMVVAVPAWEMETWWFLFPSAVSAICSQWESPDKYSGRSVGTIRNAKEELGRAVRPAKRKPGSFREYREEDGERIAKNVVSMGLVAIPSAKSSSFDRFVEQVHEVFG